VIELRHIGKTFPGVRALHDVSIAIQPGEVLGLVGENGAGKSTLVKILGGVYDEYDGEVAIDGKTQAFRSTRDARKAGIAIVHQELALVPELSIAENLLLGAEPTRFGMVDFAALHAKARVMLRRVLGDDVDYSAIDLTQPVSELGVGVQQCIEIARALADDAKVLVLDEPTAALSEAESEKLFALIRQRRAAGASFVYISHRLEEISALCDRVVVLRDGELVEIVAPTVDLVPLMTGAAIPDRAPARARARARVLTVTDLRVRHPALPRLVVDALSFDVAGGEVVALAGAMGAGRSATLATLFGCAKAGYTGTIAVDDKRVDVCDPRAAIAAGIAYVPEDRKAMGLVLGLTVADNLAMSSLAQLSKLGVIDGERAEHNALGRVREMSIKAPGLASEVTTLSGGNQQKIVIGKWLERGPRVLLLDEPTRGVDVGAKAEIYALIEDLTARGHAVVLASSDLSEVIRLADRVIVLREGARAGELTGDDITPINIMQLAVGRLPDQEVAREART
jgi:ribose transport system ATP-binding protein